jgi:hypothetical protein
MEDAGVCPSSLRFVKSDVANHRPIVSVYIIYADCGLLNSLCSDGQLTIARDQRRRTTPPVDGDNQLALKHRELRVYDPH